MKKQTAVQSSDAEPESAHRGKARSQSPPAEQVRTDLTMQLCSDTFCMHVLDCIDAFVCQLACQGINTTNNVETAVTSETYLCCT